MIVRLVQSGFTLFAVALLTFVLMHLVPGGPFDVLAGERAVSPEFIESQEAYYGLNDSLPRQFIRYLGHLAQGDLGISYQYRGQTVTDVLVDKIKPSILLGLMALGMVVAIGIPVGVIAAVKRNTP